MVEQDNRPPEGVADDVPADAEAQVFAKIVRYLSERLSEVEPGVDPGDLAKTGALFAELAEAFETTGGFEFSTDQALPLSHAFVMLEGGMRVLADQAHEAGQTNAAAKMEWAALKARSMTAKLESSHLQSTGGIIAFGMEEAWEDPAENPSDTD